MTEPPETCRDTLPREDPSANLADPGPRSRQNEALTRGLEAARASGQVDIGDLLQHLNNRSAATARSLAKIGQIIERLDERLSRVETRLTALTDRTKANETSIKLICEVLRDLDDPYGFGRSLDDEMSRHEPDRSLDDGV